MATTEYNLIQSKLVYLSIVRPFASISTHVKEAVHLPLSQS